MKLRNSIFPVGAAAAFALAFAALPSAQAIPTMRISVDGGADFIVTDGVVGNDVASGVPGIVNFNGAFGSWTFTVNTGTTKPANGGATNAEMHLAVTGTSTSQVATTLDVRFSEDFFGPISGTFRQDASSTVDATAGSAGNGASLSSRYDTANVLFGAGTAITATQNFGPGATSSNLFSGLVVDPNVYSLTTRIVLTHVAGAGRSSTASIDLVQAVPDGGFTLSLLGSAVLGLAAVRRKLISA